MKIALVILHADPARGGAERYTIDLANALEKRGHRAVLVASNFGQGIAGASLNARGATKLGQYNRFLDSLDAHLREESYDVVHAMLPVRTCDLYHPHAGLAAEAVASGHLKHAGRPMQALSRVANSLNAKRQRLAQVERGLLIGKASPGVLCLSEYIKGTVREHYPALGDEKLLTLFNAVDLAKFDPKSRPSAGPEIRRKFSIAADAPLALMIAQDYERKGLATAIEALAIAKEKRLTLVVVGKQPPGKYAAMASKEGVNRRVIFAGSTTDPYAFYRAADMFVLPTRHDPCSLVVLESLAMGVPVISTRLNGACEIMTPAIHGHVMDDPGDAADLAHAMDRLCDASTRKSASDACLELRPVLSFDTHVQKLEGIYAACMSE